MMSLFLRYFLPIYFLAFIGLAFFWRTYVVWKATGHNPYKLAHSDSAHDYIGFWFRILVLAGAGMVVLFTLFPKAYSYLLPVFWLANPTLMLTGVVLLVAGLAWAVMAQANMGRAWRIGMDSEIKTDLVRHGLFTFSRNPVYLGMRVILLGLFLVLPNALSFGILVLGEALIQVQVRLEEEYLLRMHGDSYREYCHQTRRWL